MVGSGDMLLSIHFPVNERRPQAGMHELAVAHTPVRYRELVANPQPKRGSPKAAGRRRPPAEHGLSAGTSTLRAPDLR